LNLCYSVCVGQTNKTKLFMTLKQARKALEKVGFNFSNGKITDGSIRFGTRPPEIVNCAPNHFAPKFRHVWISKEARGKCRAANGVNFLVGSHLKGTYRRHRGHIQNAYDRDLFYVSGLGTSLEQAVENFLIEFKNQVKI
jgi:hypothetical protein